MGDPRQHVLRPAHAFCAHLPFRGRHRQADPGQAGANRGIDVGLGHAAPGDRSGVTHDAADLGHGLYLAAAHGGRAGLDLIDAGGVERAGDRDLLGDGEGDARRLLAVAQGAVVDPDQPGRLRDRLVGPGNGQVGHPRLHAGSSSGAKQPACQRGGAT